MPAHPLAIWLKKKQREELSVTVISATLETLGGGLILALTSGCLFLGLFLVLDAGVKDRYSVGLSLTLTVLLIGLGILDNLRASRDEISPLWVIRECLYIGPRLLVGAWQNARRARAFSHLDLDCCERVLAYLLTRHQSVSREELLRALPGLRWQQILEQLSLLEGVLFLREDRSRVTLIEPFRLSLRQFVAQAKTGTPLYEKEPPKEPAANFEPERLSPHDILGVSPSATVAEIKAAYRRRMKQCHPDRFATSGLSAQQMAEEWSKNINAAYDAALAAHAARRN